MMHVGIEFIVIIFCELEKDSLRKGEIAYVCEKVVNWIGRFACDDCGCDNSRLTQVFAEFGAVTQPIESENTIEVELNDDYFNPKVITIPYGRMTTLILKNKGTKSTPSQWKSSELTPKSSREKKKPLP